MLPPDPRPAVHVFPSFTGAIECLPLVLKPVYLLLVIATNANTYALTYCCAWLQIKFELIKCATCRIGIQYVQPL